MEKSSLQVITFWFIFGMTILAVTAALLIPTTTAPTTEWAQYSFTYFVNTLPFLILGSLTAGFIHHYLTPQTLQANTPKNLRNALLATSLLGLALPFGKVGIIPIVWVLLKKQFPLHFAITLLLAAPAVNPITFLALTTTLGLGWAISTTALSLIIAISLGALTYRLPHHPPPTTAFSMRHHRIENAPPPTIHPFWTPITTASDTLLTFLPFFIIGCLLSAIWDTADLTLWLTTTMPTIAAVLPIALFSAHHPLTAGSTAAGLLNTTSAAVTAIYLTLGTMFGLTTTTTLIPVLKPQTIMLLIILTSLITLGFGFIITLFV